MILVTSGRRREVFLRSGPQRSCGSEAAFSLSSGWLDMLAVLAQGAGAAPVMRIICNRRSLQQMYYHTARRVRRAINRALRRGPLSKIARRQFLQLSAVAAAGCVVHPGAKANAQEMPRLTEDDPVGSSMRYTHDASTVDPASRANPAEVQTCENCALVQGEDGEEWRPCQIFPGKLVAADGWCSVWAPKA